MPLSGLLVPLITPFDAGGELALDALESHAHAVLDAGADGVVALGTTGEPATLSAGERSLVVEVCARVCDERRAALVVGAGGNSTAATIEALQGIGRGVTAALTVVPYYTRPSEAGVVAHFRAVAAASPVPIIVYNIPYRTGRPLRAETLRELAEIPGVVGFKHAVGGIDDATVSFLASGPSVSVLAGDDLFASAMLALGAPGGILATANVAPRTCARLVAAWRAGDVATGRAVGNRLAPAASALFGEPNPVLVKAVLAERGVIPTPTVRLPLLPAGPERLAEALVAVHGLD